SQAPDGLQNEVDVHLLPSTRQKREVSSEGLLKRSKRRWSPLPFNIIENDSAPFPKDVELIGSDSSANRQVFYTISGPGVTEEPVRLFSVIKETGMVRVHRPIDREEYPQFVFTAKVFDQYTEQETDDPLPVTVIIDDVNDNKPTFTSPLRFSVLEKSKEGTTVGQVNATDRDQAGTLHSKISFFLLSALDKFAISPETGIISVRSNMLDREVQETLLVPVEIKDMNGGPTGLSNTATATIVLGDINDNPPTFTSATYNVKVEENKDSVLLLRIPVEDKDLKNTPNWNSQFEITKGNENGNFRIDRDPLTNEGLLYLVKSLDYENTKDVKLEVMARNEAKLTGTTASWLTIPLSVEVLDVDEGPEFTAPVVLFPIKENSPLGTFIGTYTAVDPETKSSAGIKYYKVSDPAEWVTVNENTGEVKVAGPIDHESSFVINSLYNVSVKAVDASKPIPYTIVNYLFSPPAKVGTGKVILRVDDENDHTPVLPSSELLVCERNGQPGSTLVVAQDADSYPNAAPFSFTLGDGHDGKWTVEKFTDTTAWLNQTKELPTGLYTVPLVVKDLQGSGNTQTVTVRICQCRSGACVDPKTTISLGVWAILAMLLALALLLLLCEYSAPPHCICCALVCVTKGDKLILDDVGDSGGILLKSNIEAPGDQVDSNLLIVPRSGLEHSVKGSVHDAGWAGHKGQAGGGAGMGGFHSQQSTLQQWGGHLGNGMQSSFSSGQHGGRQFISNNLTPDGDYQHVGFLNSATHHTWQTNGLYLQQKLGYLGTEEEGRYAEDILHAYGFEGQGSPAGSVGCCSDIGNQDNLDFLEGLGPKFRTLAEVCTKK
ncbi:desmocollin 2-like protein, partial [Aplochiton taeniatus]